MKLTPLGTPLQADSALTLHIQTALMVDWLGWNAVMLSEPQWGTGNGGLVPGCGGGGSSGGGGGCGGACLLVVSSLRPGHPRLWY